MDRANVGLIEQTLDIVANASVQSLKAKEAKENVKAIYDKSYFNSCRNEVQVDINYFY